MNSPTERNTATEMGTATDRRPAEGTGGGSGVRIGVLVTALLAACFAFQLNASMLSPALKNIEDTSAPACGDRPHPDRVLHLGGAVLALPPAARRCHRAPPGAGRNARSDGRRLRRRRAGDQRADAVRGPCHPGCLRSGRSAVSDHAAGGGAGAQAIRHSAGRDHRRQRRYRRCRLPRGRLPGRPSWLRVGVLGDGDRRRAGRRPGRHPDPRVEGGRRDPDGLARGRAAGGLGRLAADRAQRGGQAGRRQLAADRRPARDGCRRLRPVLADREPQRAPAGRHPASPAAGDLGDPADHRAHHDRCVRRHERADPGLRTGRTGRSRDERRAVRVVDAVAVRARRTGHGPAGRPSRRDLRLRPHPAVRPGRVGGDGRPDAVHDAQPVADPAAGDVRPGGHRLRGRGEYRPQRAGHRPLPQREPGLPARSERGRLQPRRGAQLCAPVRGQDRCRTRGPVVVRRLHRRR